MSDSRRRKLRVRRTTLRSLTEPELRTARGADDVHQVTRAFTDCEYCGNTNAPGACQESYQEGCPGTYANGGGCTWMAPACISSDEADPRCDRRGNGP